MRDNNEIIFEMTTLSKMKKKNIGEEEEKKKKKLLFNNRNNIQWLRKKFPDQQEEVLQGIEVINPSTNQPITSEEQIKKAASSLKADIKIKFNSTQREIGVSIKCFMGANPCVLNTTSREKFINNDKLSPYLASVDALVRLYLLDPGLTSENDRYLFEFGLTDKQKNDVALVIAYFMLEGTGTGDATVPANGVFNISKSGELLPFIELSTDEEKINYVLDKWNKYIISIRGVKRTKSGNLRANGLSKKEGYVPTKEQEPWVCYYDDNGELRPRGAIAIRIGK